MTPEFRTRLIKLLGMLGSEHIGERAAAATMVTRALRDVNLSWDQLLVPAVREGRAFRSPDEFRRAMYEQSRKRADVSPGVWQTVDDVLRNADAFREMAEAVDAMMGAQPFAQYGPGHRGRRQRPK